MNQHSEDHDTSREVARAAALAARRIAGIQRMSARLSRALTLQQVAAVIVTEGMAQLDSLTGVLVVHEGGELVIVADQGLPEAISSRYRRTSPAAEIAYATAFRTAALVEITTPEEYAARFPASAPEAASVGIGATLAAPVLIDGEAIGAIVFGFAAPQVFDEDQRQLILVLAAQAAIAIERVRLLESQAAARRTTEAAMTRSILLQRVAAGFSRAATLDDVAQVFVTQAVPALGGSAGALLLLDDEERTLVMFHIRGYAPSYSQLYSHIPLSEAMPATKALHSGEPVFWRDRDELARDYPVLADTTAVQAHVAGACLPLIAGEAEHRLGVAVVRYAEARELGADERALLTTVAMLCAQALERARLYDEERKARRARERELARNRVLAEASRALAEAPRDTHAIARCLVDVIQRLLGDGSDVRLVSADGAWLEPVAWEQRDPALIALFADVMGRAFPASAGFAGAALQSGAAMRIDGDELVRLAPPEHRASLAQAAFSELVVVPMGAGAARRVGVLTIVRNSGHPERFADDDLTLLQELADRGGLAVAAAQEHARVRIERERYQALVQATTQMVWITDAAGRLVEDSPSWRAFTGQPCQPCDGSHGEAHGSAGDGQGWLAAVHPGDRERARQAWSQAVVSRSAYVSELRLRRHDDVHVHCVVRAAPVVDGDGSVREWIGIATDISERKQAEQALQEANRRKDEFLALLGHELRNPLAPIVTALHLMKLRGVGGDKERALIERQVQHVSSLVDDLLDVSRITRGKIVLKREPVELDSVLVKAIETASPLFEQRRQKLTVELLRDGTIAEVDPVRFGQIITNLLTNAAKYTPLEGQITLAATRRGDTVSIAVRDTGIGIATEVLPRLWEPFFQAERTLERSQGGLGLGLALVKSLTELHAGRVEAFSAGTGGGSEFVVTIRALSVPADAPNESDEPDEGDDRDQGDQASARPGSGSEQTALARRLLIVDDNPDAADVLAEVLRTIGHEVVIAYDGAQALASARNYDFDFAILDLGLPIMDGYELAHRLRNELGRGRARYVAVTGYGQKEDLERSRMAGFERHLTKPVDPALLLAVITEGSVHGEPG